jgi:hypothetical protein
LIIGYTDNGSYLLIAGFDATYTISKVPVSEFLDSFFEIPENDLSSANQSNSIWWKALWTWEVPSQTDHYPLNFRLIHEQMVHYEHGHSSLQLEIPINLRTAETLQEPEANGTWGMLTYHPFEQYFISRVNNQQRVDLRATKTLWEHKCLMSARIFHCQHHGIIFPAEVAALFDEISATAKQIHLMAYLYNSRKEKALLNPICRLLNSLRDAELYAWPTIRESIASHLS